MTFYADMAAVADELLAELGVTVTLRTVSAGDYDPDTGTAALTTTDQTGNGALFDYGLHASGQSFGEGTMIVSGDKNLLLSPVGITAPAAGGKVIAAGVTWEIVSVKTTAPSGVPVLYEVQLRR